MGTSKNIPLWCDDRGSSSQRGRSFDPWPHRGLPEVATGFSGGGLIGSTHATQRVARRFTWPRLERANEPKAFIGVTGGGHLVLGSPEVFVGVREWIDTKTMVKRHSGTARK
jgi:hypothetical protein